MFLAFFHFFKHFFIFSATLEILCSKTRNTFQNVCLRFLWSLLTGRFVLIWCGNIILTSLFSWQLAIAQMQYRIQLLHHIFMPLMHAIQVILVNDGGIWYQSQRKIIWIKWYCMVNNHNTTIYYITTIALNTCNDPSVIMTVTNMSLVISEVVTTVAAIVHRLMPRIAIVGDTVCITIMRSYCICCVDTFCIAIVFVLTKTIKVHGWLNIKLFCCNICNYKNGCLLLSKQLV